MDIKKLSLLLFSIIIFTQTSFSQEIKIDRYCKKIKTELDKFSGETKHRSPLLKQIGFTKIIKGDEQIIYMSIRTVGSTPPTGEGVIILFENGERITKNIETSVRVNSKAQFEHSAFFGLTREDIELLKNNTITDTKLYIFDMKITKAIQYRAYITCLDQLN